jgi:tRNA nucleotidyltransferase/poly(A) polymerase
MMSLLPETLDPSNFDAIGTPLEDCYRRDLTINSLYYNLQTREIEDYSGQGFDDLRNKIIRTNIPPSRTFEIDPLRILRAVRFACRLNFSFHPDILKYFQEEETHLLVASLKDNIAFSRKQTEMTKMMMDNGYQRGIYFMYKWKLLPTVLILPETNVFSYQRKIIQTNETKGNNNQTQHFDFQSTTLEGRKNRELLYAGGVWKSLFGLMILPLLNGQQSFEGKKSFLSNYQFDNVKSKLNGLLTNPEQRYRLR